MKARTKIIFRAGILLFLTGSVGSSAWPQSTVKIAGHVRAASGEPLVGANVVVEGTGLGAATDRSGYFSIENLFAGEYTLKATFVGYAPAARSGVQVQRDHVTEVNFTLQPLTVSLPEVVVEAPSQDKRVPGAFTTVIGREEIENSAARTVGELLLQVPGVEVLDEGGSGRKRVSIRGSNANQVLVLLDGVPLNDPLLGEVDLNQISLASVAEVRIVKGGAGSRFGNGAVGGVIEIVSGPRLAEERVRLLTHVGSFGAFGLQPSLSGRFDRLKYFFSFERLRETGDFPYSYERLDGLRLQEQRLNADFGSENYFGKMSFGSEDRLFSLQANWYRSERGLPGLVFAWTPFARAEAERQVFIGSYRRRIRSWQAQLQVSRHRNRSEFQNVPAPDAPLRFRTVPAYHTKYEVLSHRGAVQVKGKWLGRHELDFKTEIRRDDFSDRDLLRQTAGAVRETENVTYSTSLHALWSLPASPFFDKVSLTTGLRFDAVVFENRGVRRGDQQWSPGFGVLLTRYTPWLVSLQANWGRSFRSPTFADLFYQDFRVRGNPNLLPEKSLNFEGGVRMGWPLVGWVEIEGAYFRHRVENLIIWELGSFATYRPFNTHALLRGVEFTGSWSLWQERLRLDLNHVILQALDKSGRRTTNNKALPYRPARTTRLQVQLDLGFLYFQFHRRWVGERFVTASNTVRMPSYGVSDLTLRLRRRLGRFEANVKLTIFNVGNTRYEIVERAPLPGRHWRLGLEVTY